MRFPLWWRLSGIYPYTMNSTVLLIHQLSGRTAVELTLLLSWMFGRIFPWIQTCLEFTLLVAFFFLRFVYLLIKRQREKSFIYRVTPQMDATSGTVSGWCLEPVIPSRSLMWVEGPKDQAIICSIMEANLVYQDSERWCSSHKQKLNLVFNTHPSNL